MGVMLFFSILSVIVILSAFSLFVLTRHLLHVALDRVPPRSLANNSDILNNITNNREFMTSLYSAQKRLECENTETVSINGYGGTRLIGHFLSCEAPERIIIAVHGWRSSWSRDFGTIADFWKSSHSSVLFVEQRAQKESGGDYMTFGVLERYDVLEWIRFIGTRNIEELPIYLCGVSMGATTVLMSSALGLPHSVKGIIADCGYTSAMDIWESVVHRYFHLPYLLMRGAADKIFLRKTGCSASCSTVDAMKKCTVPILFVHGEVDDFVPLKMTYENYNACSAEKYLLTVKDANHGMCYFKDKGGYERAMLDFWKKTAA